MNNGTDVRFEVAAGTATVWGPASAIEATPTERPAAPGNLVAAARPRTIELSWTDPIDTAITRYEIRYKAGSGNWNPNWTPIANSDDTTTTHTLTGLANGTIYTIEVRAARGTTLGVAGQVISTPRPAPPTPAGFTATAGDEQADLSWTNPSDTSITKYQSRHRADGETNWTAWADIAGSSDEHTVTGLTNDTTYTFQLRAVRDLNNAGPSASATATPKPPPPAAVAGLIRTPGATRGDGEIALSWTAPTPSDPRISRYEYRVKRDGQSAWRPDWTKVPESDANTTSYTVTGLLNDTTYTVEVRAVRGADTAGDAGSATIKTPKPAPRGFVAIAGNGQVDLSWTDPEDEGITKYQFRQSTDGGSSWSSWTDITVTTNSDKGTVAHTVPNLTNGMPVTFEIRAHGTPPQEGVAARVAATPVDTSSVPAAPENARASAGNTSVTLSWDNPENDQISEYQYRVSADGGTTWSPDWTVIPNSDANTTRFTVTKLEDDAKLENGKTYQIDIRAVNSTGNGAVTSLIATPKAPVSTGGFGGIPGGGGPSGPPPSTVDFEWNVTRDIEALDSSNDTPTGMWSDGVTVWLADNASGAGDAVYAYDLETGERVEAREFALATTNRAPRGFWSGGGIVWVSDSGRDRLFAYDGATGQRLEEREIALARRNRDARGIWGSGEAIWVLNANPSLYVYDPETGALLGEYTLHDANRDPRGMWSDGVTLWVSDHGAKRIFAYRLPALPEAELPEDPPALERVVGEEFEEPGRVGNNSPRGIWSDGVVMYVADANDGKVYTYNMPDAIDARLASLSLEGVDIGEFDPRRTDYDGAPDEGVTVTTVAAEAVQDGATFVIEPPDVAGVTPGHQIALDGVDEITVTVTSEDGSRTRVYRVALEETEQEAEPEPWAHCLKGAVAEGFSLLVYEGGTVDELAACAGSRSVDALYALSDGAHVSYILEAPAFVNRQFRELFADGAPALTPLIAASEGPPSADPVVAAEAGLPWTECVRGDVAEGFSAVVYEGGSVAALEACAQGRAITSVYVLEDGGWASYVLGAPDFVNRPFHELFADGVPAVTPLVVRSDGPPPVTAGGSGGGN
ncbi:MAG: fibronectin type III domain-containing protein [Acidobacteria bacterium]|nr:fibronectin type III domain-containing protein [Acidobacteriota bacterium]